MAMDGKSIGDRALELFLENGFENVTVQDICDACSITKPTFYRHVSSKEQIVLDAYEAIAQKLPEELLEVFDTDDRWEQIVRCFDVLISESCQMGPELLSKALEINLSEDRHTIDMRAPLTSTVVRVIELAQAEGRILNASPADELFQAASYLFSGYELTWCIKKGAFDWKSEMHRSLELLLQPAPAEPVSAEPAPAEQHKQGSETRA